MNAAELNVHLLLAAGVVAVGESHEDAQQRYDAAVATLRAVAALEREHAAVQ